MNAGLEAQQRGSELLERIYKQILYRIGENLKETYDCAEYAFKEADKHFTKAIEVGYVLNLEKFYEAVGKLVDTNLSLGDLFHSAGEYDNVIIEFEKAAYLALETSYQEGFFKALKKLMPLYSELGENEDKIRNNLLKAIYFLNNNNIEILLNQEVVVSHNILDSLAFKTSKE